MRNRANRGNKKVKKDFGPYDQLPKDKMLLDDYNLGMKK